MKAVLLNRVAIILSFLGLFVAGTLSLSHVLKVSVPCGVNSGCDRVTTSAAAFWGPVPVAYFGFAAYAVLAILAVVRANKPVAEAQGLVKPGLAISLLGVLASGYFTYVALFQIKATCHWCLSSAAIMVLLALVHYVLTLTVTISPQEQRTSGGMDFGLSLGSMLAVAFGLLVQASIMKTGPKIVADADRAVSSEIQARILAKPLNAFGPEDAPVTIVEFLDFYCPACRGSYTKVMDIAQKTPAMRVAYRHYPLYMKQGHENSLLASVLSELAAEKGKFWEFIDLVMTADVAELADSNKLFELYKKLGLDPEEARKRAPNDKDPAFERVYADIETANKAGLNLTPTFYVFAKGLPTKVVNGEELEPLLQTKEYQVLLHPAPPTGPLAPKPADSEAPKTSDGA